MWSKAWQVSYVRKSNTRNCNLDFCLSNPVGCPKNGYFCAKTKLNVHVWDSLPYPTEFFNPTPRVVRADGPVSWRNNQIFPLIVGSYAKLLAQKKAYTWEQVSTPMGRVWDPIWPSFCCFRRHPLGGPDVMCKRLHMYGVIAQFHTARGPGTTGFSRTF